MFGYPTGVGALIARNGWRLARFGVRGFCRWDDQDRIGFGRTPLSFAGMNEAAFEDGIVNYLTIPAVGIGLRHPPIIGMDTISTRVRCLTGWLIDALTSLRHRSGVPLAHAPIRWRIARHDYDQFLTRRVGRFPAIALK